MWVLTKNRTFIAWLIIIVAVLFHFAWRPVNITVGKRYIKCASVYDKNNPFLVASCDTLIVVDKKNKYVRYRNINTGEYSSSKELYFYNETTLVK
jgi:hypothetical protein